eukprot:1869275-Rhodomonas_salina.2
MQCVPASEKHSTRKPERGLKLRHKGRLSNLHMPSSLHPLAGPLFVSVQHPASESHLPERQRPVLCPGILGVRSVRAPPPAFRRRASRCLAALGKFDIAILVILRLARVIRAACTAT